MDETRSALLPFYLNHTLGPEEKKDVECALLADEDLRHEFFQWMDLQRNMEDLAERHRREAGPADPAHLLPLLKKRSTLYIPLKKASSRYLRVPSWAWQPALLAILVLQFAAIGLFVAGVHVERKSSYQALAAPVSESEPAIRTYNIIFAPEATEGEIRGLLLKYRAQITEGPNRIGLYHVRFSAAPPDILERFKSEKIVKFMEKSL
jgi:hypothetical protein